MLETKHHYPLPSLDSATLFLMDLKKKVLLAPKVQEAMQWLEAVVRMRAPAVVLVPLHDCTDVACPEASNQRLCELGDSLDKLQLRIRAIAEPAVHLDPGTGLTAVTREEYKY